MEILSNFFLLLTNEWSFIFQKKYKLIVSYLVIDQVKYYNQYPCQEDLDYRPAHIKRKTNGRFKDPVSADRISPPEQLVP